MADVWNPDQYGKFRAERAAPFHDLLALVEPVPAPRVVDLGCGTGDLTRVAHERLGARETVGVDSSPAMLERAAAFNARFAGRSGSRVVAGPSVAEPADYVRVLATRF